WWVRYSIEMVRLLLFPTHISHLPDLLEMLSCTTQYLVASMYYLICQQSHRSVRFYMVLSAPDCRYQVLK
ncbi:hypothetical protein ABTM11_20680, partial [Acinetobacter baumannii]